MRTGLGRSVDGMVASGERLTSFVDGTSFAGSLITSPDAKPVEVISQLEGSGSETTSTPAPRPMPGPRTRSGIHTLMRQRPRGKGTAAQQRGRRLLRLAGSRTPLPSHRRSGRTTHLLTEQN